MSVKEEAAEIVANLPEEATWEELMYRLYVRQAVQQGIDDVAAGRTVTSDEIREALGLTK